MNSGKLIVTVLIILVGNLIALGQTDPTLETGLKPYGSYHGGNLDSVSLSNGNLTLHIALPGYPQRGSFSYTPRIMYNNKGWYVVPNCNSKTGVCSPYWAFHGAGVGLDMSSEDGFSISWGPAYPGASTYSFRATTSDGSSHQLASDQAGGMITIDGTNIWYDGSTPSNMVPGVSRDRHGNRITGGNMEDTNGNFFSVSSDSSIISDTLGRNFQSVYSNTTDTSGCTGPLAISFAGIYSLPGFNNSTRQIKVCYASVRLQSNYQASGYYNDILTAIADRGYTVNFLQSVVLYNGVWAGSPAWTFEYSSREPGDPTSVNYGDLTRITLPSGGTISYTWGSINACDQHAVTPLSQRVASRTVDANDGSGPHTWTYQFGLVTDPAGNDTLHTFTALNNSCSLYETQTKYFQGSYTSGTLLKTVNTDYRWIANPFDNVVPGNTLYTVTQVFPIRVTTTWPSGKVTKTETDYDNNLQFSVPQFTGTGTYGNVIETREYDYGNGVPGPLLRRTDYTYKAFDGSPSAASYLAGNLVSLVSAITVYDGNGNQVAKTTYGYDESSLQPSAGTSSITTQHDTSLPNPGTRGNRTSEGHWLNTTAAILTTSSTYYDTGTPYQTTDPNGNTITNFYGPGFQSNSNFVGAYVTQVQNALQQNTFLDYDFNTGLHTATKDANSQISTSDYDFLSRILHSNAPDTGRITWTYNDTQPPTLTVSNTISGVQNTVQVSPRTQEADLDGLGRLVTTRLTSDPEGTDFVDTTYDPLGRVATISNPHRSTASSTDGVTTTYYDALGRTVQTAPQDGTVLPVGTAPTQCQVNNVCTDYSQFPMVTVTDQTGNQRRTRSDALGRLIEVDEPAALGPPTAATGSISISGAEQSTQVLTNPATGSSGTITIGGAEQRVAQSDCPGRPPCYLYDGGALGVSVNGGAFASANYGQGSTSTGLAPFLSNSLNNTYGSILTASASNNVVTITSKQTGSGTNYPLSTSVSYDSGDFSHPSFTLTASGPTLTGGTDNVYSTVYDSGTVSLSIPGCATSPSASYSQSGNNTATSVASALAGSVNSIAGCPVSASSSGATITFTAIQLGSSVNVSVTGSSSTGQGGYFAQPSFFASNGTVSGGLDHTGGFLTPAVTLYGYDTLGNLTQVQQQGFSSSCDANCRVRSFQYDSLSRLLTATNPESGTIAHSYDADGNLLQRTSPAPNAAVGSTAMQTVSYCYDALNRVTGKAYSPQTCTNGLLPSGTAVVSYTYDQGTNGIGRLGSLTDQAGSGSYTYDVMGRIASETRIIAGFSKSMSYLYYLDGSVNTLTYPSGTTVTYTPSAAARMLSAVDKGKSVNYVTGATYGSDGSVAGFSNGGTITNSFNYNNRLQPINMSAASPSGTIFSLNYDFHLGTGDNGNVFAITNNKDNTRNQSFTYDQLNRLVSAQNAGTDCTQGTVNGKTKFWGNGYTYDAWGNLTGKGNLPGSTSPKCGSESLDRTADAQNRLHVKTGADYQYDAAGNMAYDAVGQYYTYDQENRITGAGGLTYLYDADGNRVEKCTAGGTPRTCATNPTGTLYWYMSPGIVAESDLSGNLTSEYVFFNGERVARRDNPSGPSPTVVYYFSDHLKTTDIVTDATGHILNESDYYPWGGELQFANADSNHYKFTGKERDTETGLDYFGARYYSNGLGRFISPDWAAKAVDVPYAEFSDPQSLNLYSYVRNVPTTRFDADGHCPDACVIEGTVGAGTVIVVGVIATVAGVAAVASTPAGQRSLSTFTSAAGASIDHSVDTIKGWFGHKADVPAPTSQTLPADGVPASGSQTLPADGVSAPTSQTLPASGVPASTNTSTNTGTIYVVPGTGTQSGKSYVGRHNKENPAKTRRSNDGRDRSQAEVVNTYPAEDTQAGRVAEQQEMDKRGGVDNLDNKRNEIAPKKQND